MSPLQLPRHAYPCADLYEVRRVPMIMTPLGFLGQLPHPSFDFPPFGPSPRHVGESQRHPTTMDDKLVALFRRWIAIARHVLYWLFPPNIMSETQEAPMKAAATSSSSDVPAATTSSSSSWKLPDGIENHIEAGNFFQNMPMRFR